MADVTINREILKDVLTGEITHCKFHHLIPNFDNYIDLGTLSRNYDVNEEEIVRIANEFDFEFSIINEDEWPEGIKLDRLSSRVGIYTEASIYTPGFHDYYHHPDRYTGYKPTISIDLRMVHPDIDSAINDDQFVASLFAIIVHELSHAIGSINETEEELEETSDKKNKQSEERWKQFEQKKKVTHKYPFMDAEFSQVMQEIHALENQGLSTDKIRSMMMSIHRLTPAEARELIERAMTWKEGSYRKLSEPLVPVDLKYLKDIISVNVSRKSTSDVYTRLFHGAEDFIDFGLFDNEFLSGTPLKSRDIFETMKNNIILKIYDSDETNTMPAPVTGFTRYNFGSGRSSIDIIFYLRHTEEFSLDKLASRVWGSFVHELIHIIRYTRIRYDMEMKDADPGETATSLYYSRESQIGAVSKEERDRKYPFIDDELASNYEALIHLERSGASIELLYQYGKEHWGITPAEVDAMIERSHTYVEGSYRRLPREQLMFYDSELDFLGNFGETVERKPGAEFETDHGRYRLIEYHPEFPGWYVDCVEWKQGAPVKAGAEMEFPRLINFVRDYILHRSKYAQSGDSNGVTVRYETLFPGYLESEEIQRLIREKLSTDVSGYLEILKHVGSPMGFISVTVRHTSNSPGQIMPFFVNGDVSDSGGMSLVVDVDTEDQDIQAYLPEIANHYWGFFVHEFGHMLDHFNEEDPFAMENAVPKFKKNYYPFQKSELPQAIAFIRAMEEKGKSREYLKDFAMREWELSERAFDYLYDQAHKVASYRKFSDDENLFDKKYDELWKPGSSYWVSPDGEIFDAGTVGHYDWAASVSERKHIDSVKEDPDWKAFAKWRKKYKDLYGEDTYLGCDELISNGWIRVNGRNSPSVEVQRLDSKTVNLIIDYLLKKEYRKEIILFLDVREPSSNYQTTFEDFVSGEYRHYRQSSYRKFSMSYSFWVSPDVDIFNCGFLEHDAWIEKVSELNADKALKEDSEWRAFAKWRKKYRGLYEEDKDYSYLGRDDLFSQGWLRVIGMSFVGIEVKSLNRKTVDLIIDYLLKREAPKETPITLDVHEPKSFYRTTFEDFVGGEYRHYRESSYRKFSDDELKLKDENVDVGRILILHGQDVLPMAKEALRNHLYVEGWQAKKVFSAILGIAGMDSDYGYIDLDDMHMAGYYNQADRLVAWAYQFMASPIARYTERRYRYRGIGNAIADALKEDIGGDLLINERQTFRPEGVLEKKLVQML